MHFLKYDLKMEIAIIMKDRDEITVAVTTVNLDDGY